MDSNPGGIGAVGTWRDAGANVHVGRGRKGAWQRGAAPAGTRERCRVPAHVTPKGHALVSVRGEPNVPSA